MRQVARRSCINSVGTHRHGEGRTLTICEAQALALEGSKEKLVATMTGTLMAVTGRQDIAH